MSTTYEIAIVGAGAAGFAAGIYAGRSGAQAVIFDKGIGGGLTVEAPLVENYPGIKKIEGMKLMDKMRKHAAEYAEMKLSEEVTDITLDKDRVAVTTIYDTYTTGAVILCTGTTHRKLNVPGESEFTGRGVSYCATCDGFFFRDKKVAIVGGGSSAIIWSIFLKQIGMDVTVIHRRNELRAEKTLEDEATQKGISFIWNTVVEKIIGKEYVQGVNIRNVETNKTSVLELDGVFISIGEVPQNTLAKKLDIMLDAHGYVKVDYMQRTNVGRVLAAGDITGGVRQVITACAQGAKAALAALPLVGKRSPY